LAGVFKLFGVYTPAAAFAILCLNSVFSSLTCVFLLLIGRRIFGETVGTLAAWSWVFWPSAALIPVTRVWHESLAALLLSVLFSMTLRLEGSVSTSGWVFFGALWGVAALTNPVLLSTLPFLLCWLGYGQQIRKIHPTRNLAVAVLLAGIVVLPWLLRNYVVFHRPVFITDDFGLNLDLGNHAGASGGHRGGLIPSENMHEWAQYRGLGEMAYMSAKQREALSFVARHRGELPRFACNGSANCLSGRETFGHLAAFSASRVDGILPCATRPCAGWLVRRVP